MQQPLCPHQYQHLQQVQEWCRSCQDGQPELREEQPAQSHPQWHDGRKNQPEVALRLVWGKGKGGGGGHGGPLESP